MTRPRARLAAVAGAFGLTVLSLPTGTLPGNTRAAHAADATSSAMTVSGTGDFASLKVTVDQTKNLINQIVRVHWTGGTQTQPDAGSGRFALHYLQVMQCWGDAPTGPQREQCQYGGGINDARGGNWANGRQVSYGTVLTDPAETYTQAPNSGQQAYVPFRPVNGKTSTGLLNEFYDQASTNEVAFSRTGTDGTGQEFFEMQTAREAPGIGCGEGLTDPTSGQKRGRSCWLVVVPRGDVEVDGSKREIAVDRQLLSSPLSATNWKQRIVVPLEFQPVGGACTIGSAERRTFGHEVVAEAIGRWQPALCGETGTVFSYSQVADVVARRQAVSREAGLAFLTNPVVATLVSEDAPLVYAPVALTGIGIAFHIERRSPLNAPAAVKQLDGQRVTELNLSPRLVAKLITQSYRFGVHFDAPHVKDNPRDLTRDPEFLALNPVFKDLQIPNVSEVLLPIGLSDSTAQIWDWLRADPEAKAFLAGQTDPHGMKVNPNYANLELPRDDFPKADSYCKVFRPDEDKDPLCSLDMHPYSSGYREGARSASRGDTLSRQNWDPLSTPPAWKRSPPQSAGTRAVLALVDAASAHRYSLPLARIRNAAGAFVAPTEAALLAGLAAMKPSAIPGVLAVNPAPTDPAAYPLVSVSYSVTAPARLDAKAGRDYAAFLRYAAGPGQLPGEGVGQLPAGYTPLPQTMRTQTLAAATAIEARAGKPVVTARPQPKPTARPQVTNNPTGGSSGGTSTTGGSSGGLASGGGLGTTAVPIPTPTQTAPAPAVRPTPTPITAVPVISVGRTPADALGRGRYGLVVALFLGGVAAALGQGLLRPRLVAAR